MKLMKGSTMQKSKYWNPFDQGLKDKGHRVQIYRVRESLMRTDPVGMMNRWTQAIKRRKYQVKSPLTLWHTDGNHKLIRYCVYLTLY